MVREESGTRVISLFGSTGFIGTHLTLRSKHKFDVIKRHIRKPTQRESLYLISTTDNYNVFTNPQLDIQVNLKTLIATLRKHRPGDTFNFVSSWFVYGDQREIPCSEAAICEPKGFYSITKFAAEMLIESYCKTFGINYRIFRLSNIYGPGDKGASIKKNALQFLIERLKRNEPIDLYWGGDCLRDYLHVYDLVDAIDLCLDKMPLNSIINIGSGFTLSFGSLIHSARETLNSSSEIRSIEPPGFHKTVQTRHFCMDASRLQALGFKPKVSIEEGIRQLCK